MIKLDLIRGYLRILRQDRVPVGVSYEGSTRCAVNALPHHTTAAWDNPPNASTALNEAPVRVFGAPIFDVNDKKGRDAVLQVYREAILHG